MKKLQPVCLIYCLAVSTNSAMKLNVRSKENFGVFFISMKDLGLRNMGHLGSLKLLSVIYPYLFSFLAAFFQLQWLFFTLVIEHLLCYMRNLVNPFTLKILSVILLTLCHTILMMLVWRSWYWINKQSPK